MGLFWLCGVASVCVWGLAPGRDKMRFLGPVGGLINNHSCALTVVLACRRSLCIACFYKCITCVYGSLARVIAASRAFIWCIVRVFSYGAPRVHVCRMPIASAAARDPSRGPGCCRGFQIFQRARIITGFIQCKIFVNTVKFLLNT